MPSFDIVSEVDMHEMTNAVDQANREVGTRFDFKGSNASFELKDNSVRMEGASEFQLQQMRDILYNKCGKRNIDLGSLEQGKTTTSNMRAIQEINIKQGIDKDLGKKIVKKIKEAKLKVQAAIQGEQVRVTGKKRDDLQEVIAMLKAEDAGLPLQFQNFRD